MEKRIQNSDVIEDERIESITNKYAAYAFNFLVYYLGISIIIKSFTLDVNIFLYYDYAIVMVIGWVYMIYRSADEGVAVTPVSTKVFNPGYLKMFTVASLFFGLFISFVISGMDERLAVLMPGILEKLAGTVIFGLLFFMLMSLVIWLIDVLPTNLAFRKASELADEPEDELPDDEEVVKQSHIKDERIDTTTEKYAAHALYFLFGYILFSTMVKFFIPDLNLIVYYDAFLAAMVAAAYVSYNILNAGAYHKPELSKEDMVKDRMISVIAYLVFGMFSSFILFPKVDNWAALLDSTGLKIAFGLLMAALFGIGRHLIGNVIDGYSNKRTKKLIDK